MAISALRAQQEPNTPLTLDELRKMDGEPVWVSVSNNWRESGVSEGWCIIRFHSEDDRVRVYVYDTRHGARFFAQQDYGESWIAYRQKPERRPSMRLIDGDKLLEIYKKWIPQLSSKEDEGDRRGVETCIAVLEDMQTVYAVPVVRCRECKLHTSSAFYRDRLFCQEHGRYVDPDGYCYLGERKEGAD